MQKFAEQPVNLLYPHQTPNFNFQVCQSSSLQNTVMEQHYYRISSQKKTIKTPVLRKRSKRAEEKEKKLRKAFSKAIAVVNRRVFDAEDFVYKWRLGGEYFWFTIAEALQKGFQIYIKPFQNQIKQIKKSIMPSNSQLPSPNIKFDSYSRPDNPSSPASRKYTKLQKDERMCLRQLFEDVLVRKYMVYEKRRARPKILNNHVIEIDSDSDTSIQSDDEEFCFFELLQRQDFEVHNLDPEECQNSVNTVKNELYYLKGQVKIDKDVEKTLPYQFCCSLTDIILGRIPLIYSLPLSCKSALRSRQKKQIEVKYEMKKIQH